jgi:hypothetical protein|tara:strand:- start:6 stop:461 length:456 start_codon:yes stop_codon:yes gene_type:complete
MSRENIIVDMQSPTPFDSYRFKRENLIEILIRRGKNNIGYILEMKKNGESAVSIESKSVLQNWTLIEMIREQAYRDNNQVDVHNTYKNTSYRRITLATTLDGRERGEAIEKQANRDRNIRRRMVVETPVNRKAKKYNPRILRPILREEKTW